jgi:hypothetical protein
LLFATLLLSSDDYHGPPRHSRRAAATRCHERCIHLRPEHTERVGAPSCAHGVVPRGAEERYVGLIELLAARELPAPAVECAPRVRRGSDAGFAPSPPETPGILRLSAHRARTSVRRVRRVGSHPDELKNLRKSGSFRPQVRRAGASCEPGITACRERSIAQRPPVPFRPRKDPRFQ